ncbi:MAG: Rpn family recombination-promoting nuclease/putative transposase [Bacteroidetes bacterium]|nr:Rpn family recombination-promoting nuclease/putative transposase [Bacteroidota bacterium]
MKPRYDMLWKGMIEEVIEDLLLFVDPEISKELDLEKGFQFLDKELAALKPEPTLPSSPKVVDKLVRIFLREGGERWMLLHLEVQGGKKTKKFPGRMFEYYVRLSSKYNKPIAAIAILTGPSGRNMLATFEHRCLWTKVRYDYKTICIADYPDETLAASNNPFAIVMMVAKDALLKPIGAKEQHDNILLKRKILMVKLLKQKMAILGERKTEAILTFLNNYVTFKNPETNRKFMLKTDEIFEKKNTMGIFEQLAEIKFEEGIEKGRAQEKEQSVRLLLENTKLSVEEIAKKVGVSITLVRKIKKQSSSK